MKQHTEYLLCVCVCVYKYIFREKKRCSVSLLFHYELLEFYFKVSILKVSKNENVKTIICIEFSLKIIIFQNSLKAWPQISQKVHEPELYFWFMKKTQTRSLALLEFWDFHGVVYFWCTEKLKPWWIVGGLWLCSLFQWYTHTKFP